VNQKAITHLASSRRVEARGQPPRTTLTRIPLSALMLYGGTFYRR
jgi:hypothetical protein